MTRALPTVNLKLGTMEQKRDEIAAYLEDVFRSDDALFDLLVDEAFYERPDPLRHPLIFYFGHVASFYINKLFLGQFIPARLNPALESILAVGVDEMSWDDLNDTHYDWPTVDEVRAYRAQVKALVLGFVRTVDATLPVNWGSPLWAVMMGIEHQRIHLETSAVLIRQLPLRFLRQSPHWDPFEGPQISAAEVVQNALLPVEGGRVRLGKSPDDDTYGWDNEYGNYSADIEAFSASKYLVSNAEFFAFVNAGGYQAERWWTAEGWRWRSFTKRTAPLFWREDESGWRLRLVDREVLMRWSWPVEVNYLEAKAFCQWKSEQRGQALRLPTEDEWYRLHDSEAAEATDPKANIELRYRSSTPVDMFRFARFYDVRGNVWQWTETPIYPFNDFRVHPLYDDFTVPTFDGQHNLIKGGSWISTGDEAKVEARYAFRRHFQQFAGFRYVHSTNPVIMHDNPYETDALISQYCEFHYGQDYFGVPNFPRACIQRCAPFFSALPEQKRALDLGCAVGRSTLELAQHFEQVVGIDFSARFVQQAQKMVDDGRIKYVIPTEGELVDLCERSLGELGLPESITNVEFWQGDACNLSMKYGRFDFIFAGNLIDRLQTPEQFLRSVSGFLAPGGILALTSPYTWLEEYTPKSEWLGGCMRDGEKQTTLARLHEILDPTYRCLADDADVPFVIRETARKYQHTVANLTLWQLR